MALKCAWCGAPLTPLGCECTPSSRRIPAHACAVCGAPHVGNAKFCSECGASYVGRLPTDKVIERRQITFVFCDLVGSTALSEGIDPEDYKDLLLAYRDAVHATMGRFGGWVDRFRGDGTLVYFGYPEAHEDDAERALHAALECIEAVRALPPFQGKLLQVRVGVASGLVVIADVEDPWERTAMGDAPNLAARLQALAEPDTAVIEAATRDLAGDLFEFVDLGLLQVKGLSAPIPVWRVVGTRAVASRFDARPEHHRASLIGRDAELGVLRQLWRTARDGTGRIALVSGEAGIGKSRLVAALLEEVARERDAAAVHRYFCSPYRQGSSLHPCIQQLEHAAHMTASDGPALRAAKLDAILDAVSPEDRSLLRELLNLPASQSGRTAALSAQAKRRRTLQALLNLLQGAARRNPVLLVFEDAQWADDSSRELLLLVAGMLSRLPVLLLILTRPGGFGTLDAHPDLTRIDLGPLATRVSERLARESAAGHELPAAIIADIVARTDGIPLFIEELTRAMVEGRSRTDPLLGAAETSSLPMLLRATLLPRLNRLGPAREILEVAAAIGREFSVQLVSLVAGEPTNLRPMLARLVGSGLVLPALGSDEVFAFKHALIRDAAYEILGREERRSLHARIAQAIEGRLPEMAANHPEILAWHYTAAGDAPKAVAHWLAAGRKALLRSAMGEALVHLQRGMALVAGAPPSVWQLQNELALTICTGMAQIGTLGYADPATAETFMRARRLCDQLGEPPQLLPVLHGLWTHALLHAQLDTAQRRAQEILARGEQRGDPLWQLMGHRFIGATLHPLGHFADAIQHLAAGIAMYDARQRPIYATVTVDDPRVVMKTYLSWSHLGAGHLAEALRTSEEALAEAREIGHVYTLARALTGASFTALTLVSPEAALPLIDELDTAIAESGIAFYDAVALVYRAWCLAGIGRHAEALDLSRRGIAGYRATHSVLYLPVFLRMLAEAHGRAGRHEEALELIGESEAVMQATGQPWDEPEIHRVRGTLLRAMDRDREGLDAIRYARTLACEQGAGLWELRACCDLLNSAESDPETRTRVHALLAGSDSSLDLPDLRRARRIVSPGG